MDLTLAEMRRQSGKSYEAVKDAVLDFDPTLDIKSRQAVVNWEIQGILDVRVIDALAAVYGRPREEVKAAAVEAYRQHSEKKNPARLQSPLTLVTK